MTVFELLRCIGKLLLCLCDLRRTLAELALTVLILLDDTLYRVAGSRDLIFVHELLSLDASPQERCFGILAVCDSRIVLRLHIEIAPVRRLHDIVNGLYLLKLCLALGVLRLGLLEPLPAGGVIRPAMLELFLPLGILRRLEKQGMCITRATLKSDIALLRECGFDVESVMLPTGEHYYMKSPDGDMPRPISVRPEISGSIADAVRNKTKLVVTLDGGGEYSVSPYAVLRDGSGYHAACFSPAHRRVILLPFSKISSARLTAEPSDPTPPDYNVSYYTLRGFELCQSASETVTFSFDSDSLGSVLSQFGDSALISREPSGLLRAEVSTEVNPALFTWVFRLGGRVRIVSPEYVCGEYKSCLRAQLAAY